MKSLLFFFFTFCYFLDASAQLSPSYIIRNNSSTILSKNPNPTDSVTFHGAKRPVYQTTEIIRYNFLDIQKNEKRRIDSSIMKTLADDSDPNTGTNSLPDTMRARLFNLHAQLEADIGQIESEQDSLFFLYTKSYLNHKKLFILDFGPIRSRAFFDMISGNSGKTFRALGDAGLSFGSKSASLYSEIVATNLSVFRVSFGTMLSKSNSPDSTNAKTQEAYQRLVNNGGNTVLNFEYPLAYLHSKNNLYNFITTVNAKGTADLPAFGTDTSKWAGSGSFGINFYGEALTRKSELSFFINFNLNMFFGTDVFKQNLGINNNNFSFGRLSVGLVFLNNFKISFVIATVSSEPTLQNKGVVVGGSVLR